MSILQINIASMFYFFFSFINIKYYEGCSILLTLEYILSKNIVVRSHFYLYDKAKFLVFYTLIN